MIRMSYNNTSLRYENMGERSLIELMIARTTKIKFLRQANES